MGRFLQRVGLVCGIVAAVPSTTLAQTPQVQSETRKDVDEVLKTLTPWNPLLDLKNTKIIPTAILGHDEIVVSYQGEVSEALSKILPKELRGNKEVRYEVIIKFHDPDFDFRIDDFSKLKSATVVVRTTLIDDEFEEVVLDYQFGLDKGGCYISDPASSSSLGVPLVTTTSPGDRCGDLSLIVETYHSASLGVD